MAISDKTRKILWGRSGNRCAFCRRELIVEATAADDESVVGDECHIISGQTHGPRHDPTFLAGNLDEPDNLILLCRIHHKMVDDQAETYTPDVLRPLKTNHEKWVATSLTDEQRIPPVRIRRVRENIPKVLVPLTSAAALVAVIGNASAISADNDEPQSTSEAELLSEFFQEAQDFGDMDFEIGDRVMAEFRMKTLLEQLESAGFRVFGARENRQMEGGTGPPSQFPVGILRVVRSTNPKIQQSAMASALSKPGKTEV